MRKYRPPYFQVKGLDISSRDIQLIIIYTISYPERLLAELTSQLISVFPTRCRLFLLYSD